MKRDILSWLLALCVVILIGFVVADLLGYEIEAKIHSQVVPGNTSKQWAAGQSVILIRMSGSQPIKPDQYCTVQLPIEKKFLDGQHFVVEIKPYLERSHLPPHHMALFTCSNAVPNEQPHSCEDDEMHEQLNCNDKKLIFVWAHDGEGFYIPNQAGVLLGQGYVQSFILLAHYKEVMPSPEMKDFSGFAIGISNKMDDFKHDLECHVYAPQFFKLDPGKERIWINFEETFYGKHFRVIAFRVHAHARGVENRLEVFDKDDLVRPKHVVSRSVQLPQSFVVLGPLEFTIQPGDLLQMTCIYSTIHEENTVYVGPTKNDEMCNIYLMGFSISTTLQIQKNRITESIKDNAGSANVQIVSVAAEEKTKTVWTFDRGIIKWTDLSFTNSNELIDKTSIKTNPVMAFDGDTTVASWGSGMFFVPHSISVDPNGDVWVADVGLHQVLKYTRTGKRLFAIGTPFVPGHDTKQLCHPTDVAFSLDGKFAYITDGYCNHRVLKVHVDTGIKVLEWGNGGRGDGQFNVPHAVIVSNGADGNEEVAVADRENCRIQVFDSTGNLIRILNQKFPVYSLVQVGSTILAGLVDRTHSRGIINDTVTGSPIENSIREPHSMAAIGKQLYVAQSVDGGKLFKFDL